MASRAPAHAHVRHHGDAPTDAARGVILKSGGWQGGFMPERPMIEVHGRFAACA